MKHGDYDADDIAAKQAQVAGFEALIVAIETQRRLPPQSAVGTVAIARKASAVCKAGERGVCFRAKSPDNQWFGLLGKTYLPVEEHEMSPSPAEVVVQRQLDAYNRRDLAAILATYADTAQQFEHPNTLLASGTAQIQERLWSRFQEPNLHAQLLHRIVLGHLVIDHERVTRTFPEGTGTMELVATYEVLPGRITRHWVAFGEKVLDALQG